MISTILVPLDGTTLSEKALPYAIRLANQLGASLLLKRVVPASNLLDGETMSHEYAQMDVVQAAKDYLNEVKKLVTDPQRKLYLPETQVQTLVAYGKPVEILTSLLEIEKVNLVVMTTHGRSSLGELFVGSTAAGVVQHSPVPVMLIRPDRHLEPGEIAPDLVDLLDQPEKLSLERPEGMARIVVALDGYEYAEKALTVAAELATSFKASLCLLEVVESSAPTGYSAGYGELVDEARQTTYAQHSDVAQQYLKTIQDKLSAQGLQCLKTVRNGNPAEEIVYYAEQNQAVCIVMATHAPGRVGRLFSGSTAQSVLHRTHLPVVMVHSVTPTPPPPQPSAGESDTTPQNPPQ